MLKQNENLIDRLVRGLLASVFLVTGYYWFGGAAQLILYIAGASMLFTAATGFCALYTIFKVDTTGYLKEPKKIYVWLLAVLIVTTLIAGSYASNFFSRKFFLEDFNQMNNYYKQALFFTGQEKRAEAIANYDLLLSSYAVFAAKYSVYQPVALRQDKEFKNDLVKIEGLIKAVDQGVRTGDLKASHTELEAVRPLWQEIFKRNGFSMLAVALVDFHDVMEKVIEPADSGDILAIQLAYPEADQKLKAVEAEVNDAEIQAIRANLDKLLEMSKTSVIKADLVKQAAALKASFVKVYLQRG